MHEIILNFPEQFKIGANTATNVRVTKTYNRIVTCGMGGSAIPGEILSMVKDNVIVHWDYDLPSGVTSQDLVICTSWSGNTQETISSYDQAIAGGLDTVVITRGGALANKAKQNNTSLVILPDKNIPPRGAVGYMAGAMFSVLGQENSDIAIDEKALDKTGKDLAEKLGDKIPLIYASYKWRKLAGFWKILFNENAKTHAFANCLPSAAHNEIAAFDGKNKDLFVPIIFKDTNEDPRHARNLDALLAIFDQMRYNYHIVNISEVSSKPLEMIFNNYVLGLWTSYYLAKNLGVNPEDTELIEKFKELKRTEI